MGELINLKGRDDSEDLDADGNMMLEWIIGTYYGRVWTG
jgi:hypothetical protein